MSVSVVLIKDLDTYNSPHVFHLFSYSWENDNHLMLISDLVLIFFFVCLIFLPCNKWEQIKIWKPHGAWCSDCIYVYIFLIQILTFNITVVDYQNFMLSIWVNALYEFLCWYVYWLQYNTRHLLGLPPPQSYFFFWHFLFEIQSLDWSSI